MTRDKDAVACDFVLYILSDLKVVLPSKVQNYVQETRYSVLPLSTKHENTSKRIASPWTRKKILNETFPWRNFNAIVI